MTAVFHAIIIGAVLVFSVGCVVRAVRYARLPIHLRWELYPVAHEAPSRVEHGGSYFEQAEWWTRPRRLNVRGELRFMVPEMLFMRGLWEFNRALWCRSFPFHFGLYLLAGTCGLVLLTALLDLFAPGLGSVLAGRGLMRLYVATGFLGLALALFGAVALLVGRLTAENLKTYTTPGDLFNLSWFIVALGCVLAGLLLEGPGGPGAAAVARAILTFDTGAKVPPVLGLGLALSALLAAYIPFTHMSHFIGKYFTYHAVRWDDRPNLPGGRIERQLAGYLAYRPTWSAPHVGADGIKTWADVARTNPGGR